MSERENNKINMYEIWMTYLKGIYSISLINASYKIRRIPFLGKAALYLETRGFSIMFKLLWEHYSEDPEFQELEKQAMTIIDEAKFYRWIEWNRKKNK